MSPTMLARLRVIERETRRLAQSAARLTIDGWEDPARYPRDYYRPAELVRGGGGTR